MRRIRKINTAMTSAGEHITVATGTMWVAIAFAALAFVSLPAVLATRDVVVIVTWITQSFLQLVLLPIILVGQNGQGALAEGRSIETLADVKTLLSEHAAANAAQHAATRAHMTQVITESIP
jgi:Mg/Co/Ni transporter MgtE